MCRNGWQSSRQQKARARLEQAPARNRASKFTIHVRSFRSSCATERAGAAAHGFAHPAGRLAATVGNSADVGGSWWGRIGKPDPTEEKRLAGSNRSRPIPCRNLGCRGQRCNDRACADIAAGHRRHLPGLVGTILAVTVVGHGHIPMVAIFAAMPLAWATDRPIPAATKTARSKRPSCRTGQRFMTKRIAPNLREYKR